MRIASFFSGIGGLELGLERATNGTTVFQCERDPYARRVLAKHWPDVPRFDDVRAFASRRWLDSHPLPDADVWCGGFPCQDISIAGKQIGIHGARSGLFFEWMRAVRMVRPQYLVLENVPAILACDNLGPVLGALAEAGYDAEWDVLSAAAVGAPHLRERWFCIAWDVAHATKQPANQQSRVAMQRRRSGEAEQTRMGGRAPDGTEQPRSLADADGSGPRDTLRAGWDAAGRGGGDVADANSDDGLRRTGAVQVGRGSGQAVDARSGRVGDGAQWSVEPDVGRVAHGVPARVDRLRCLGNAVVPACAEVIGRRLLEISQAAPLDSR